MSRAGSRYMFRAHSCYTSCCKDRHLRPSRPTIAETIPGVGACRSAPRSKCPCPERTKQRETRTICRNPFPTATEPLKFYILMRPSGDSFTSTLFGVAGAPAVTFRFDNLGTVVRFAGNSRMFDDAVAFTAVTFNATATASDGIDSPPVHSPLDPCTFTVNV